MFHNVCGVIEGRALSPDYVSTVSASLSQCSLRIQGPFLLSACHWDHVTRPRFWWLLGEIRLPPVTLQFENTFRVLEIVPQVVKRCWSEALEPGWKPFAVAHGLRTVAEFNFVCFMPFVPGNPEDRMATANGYAVAPETVRARWRPDVAAQSPFQYEELNLVVARNGSSRKLVSRELEALHRYPKGYTAPVILFEGSKAGVANHLRDAPGLERLESERLRKSLIGTSWHVGVTEFWLNLPHVHCPFRCGTDGFNRPCGGPEGAQEVSE